MMRVLIIVLLFTACSSNKTVKPATSVQLSELRVLTVSNPQIKVTTETPLTWYSNLKIHS